MKYLKMLGLAAVAAMALMAFVGAGSASATTLCKTPETSSCAAGWNYPAGTEIHASLEAGTSALLTDTSKSIIEDTCTTATIKGTTSNTGSATETVKGTSSSLTFGSAETKCSNTTTVLSEAGTLEVHWIEGTTNGTLTATGFEVTVLASGVSCVYGASTGIDLGKVTGGSMATMDVEGVVKKVGGSFLCPSDSLWTAKYTVTSPEPLYISGS